MKNSAKILLTLTLAAFFGLSAVCAQKTFAQQTQARAPIDVFIIVDGSVSFSKVKNEITAWVNGRLDQILVTGDRVTVWNAGSQARIIYTGKIEGGAEKDAAKKSITDISPSGTSPDFSGALRDAASRQGSPYSYTLLISASPQALSSVLSSPQASLLRFSRIEEFTDWRALVVGLNIDSRVRRAASAFFSQ